MTLKPSSWITLLGFFLLSGIGAWMLGKSNGATDEPQAAAAEQVSTQPVTHSHLSFDPRSHALLLQDRLHDDDLIELVFQEIQKPGRGDLALVHAWLRNIDVSKVEDILVAARDLPPQARYRLELQLLARWAKHNPKSAVDYAIEHVAPKNLTALLNGVIAEWARQDHEAAFAWYAERAEKRDYQPGFQGLRILLTTIAQHWARQDLDGALAFSRDQLTMEEQGFALSGIARVAHLESERSALLDAVINLPDGRFRSEMVQRTAFQWSMSAPAAAARWFDEVGDTIEIGQRRAAIQGIAGNWQNQGPEATVRWLAKFGRDLHRGHVFLNSYTKWQDHDPAAAKAWLRDVSLDNFPPGISPNLPKE